MRIQMLWGIFLPFDHFLSLLFTSWPLQEELWSRVSYYCIVHLFFYEVIPLAYESKTHLLIQVLRDGHWQEQDAAILVPGDIISIKLGDIIPADARLLEGDPLKIDQANIFDKLNCFSLVYFWSLYITFLAGWFFLNFVTFIAWLLT